jgi:ABC-2 type transport system ATP-binding protein
VDISLNDAGKKFYREWIFRHANLSFSGNQKVVITGPNGSGKSTLLQVLAGSTTLTEGKLIYTESGKIIDGDSIFQYIALATPYLELIEEFTLREIVKFHIRLKPSVNNISPDEILNASGLAAKADNIFKFFSSGMKQRIKLTLALLSDTPVLLLDEPCSNLDAEGVNWYKQMISRFAGERLVIVASNEHEEEYFFCDTKLMISDFKA